ncbi:MAG: PF20097 family protein [bacterium]
MSDTPQSPEEQHMCPKCNSTMEKGIIYDIGYWRKGDLARRKIEKALNGISLVNSYKCQKCGFVEMYEEKKVQ